MFLIGEAHNIHPSFVGDSLFKKQDPERMKKSNIPHNKSNNQSKSESDNDSNDMVDELENENSGAKDIAHSKKKEDKKTV